MACRHAPQNGDTLNSTHLRLAQLLLSLREVQNIVDVLKSQPQVAPVVPHLPLDLIAAPAEDGRRLAAGCYKGGCLVKALI